MLHKTHIKFGVVMVVIAGLVFAGWQAYLLTQFRVVKTDPKLSAVSTISPYIKVYFSKPIVANSLALRDPDNLISSKSISGKTLQLNLKDGLTDGVTYELTIIKVADSSGDYIINRPLAFTAKNIGYQKLSTAQQKTLVDRQDKPVYAVDHLNYVGFDSLTAQGFTTQQLLNLKTALYNYSLKVNQQFWTMTILPSTLVVSSPDPNDMTSLAADFTVALNGVTYRAHVTYNVLSDDIHLLLSNSGGTVVYNSAN